MIVIQVVFALALAGAVITIALTLIAGFLVGVVSLIMVVIAAALVGYLVKVNWKPVTMGYYTFIRQEGAFVGKPGIAMDVWRFQQGNTCAINAQRMVLAICGIQKNERELAQRQQAYGLHSAAGSTDIQHLMAGYGLAVRTINVASKSAFIKQLYYTLRQGRLAVATVNSSLINTPDPDFHSPSRVVTNHAILVTGLRNIGGKNYRVYYTDSGVPDGALKSLDARVMQEATGTAFIETPVLFEGQFRRWPYMPKNLDKVPVEALTEGPVTTPCPQCEKGLRFQLAHEARVVCPRCAYQFKAIKVQQNPRNATWDSAAWEKAGRKQGTRPAQKDRDKGQRRTWP
jgi:hypothetical protein